LGGMQLPPDRGSWSGDPSDSVVPHGGPSARRACAGAARPGCDRDCKVRFILFCQIQLRLSICLMLAGCPTASDQCRANIRLLVQTVYGVLTPKPNARLARSVNSALRIGDRRKSLATHGDMLGELSRGHSHGVPIATKCNLPLQNESPYYPTPDQLVQGLSPCLALFYQSLGQGRRRDSHRRSGLEFMAGTGVKV